MDLLKDNPPSTGRKVLSYPHPGQGNHFYDIYTVYYQGPQLLESCLLITSDQMENDFYFFQKSLMEQNPLAQMSNWRAHNGK